MDIYFPHGEDDVIRRLGKTDLVLVDLDDCIYPGITKLAMLRNLCFILLCSRSAGDTVRLLRLMICLPVLGILKCLQILCPGVNNRILVLSFSRIITGIQFSYLEEASMPIPGNSLQGCRETLEILSEKASVGIISLGLDIVLEEYRKQFTKNGNPLINFYEGNGISRRIVRGVKVAGGLDSRRCVLTGKDKLRLAKRRIEEFQSKVPLAIGHSREDLPMMEFAVSMGGLAIGIHPCRDVLRVSDIVVRKKDWRPLLAYLSNLAYKEESK